MSYQGPPSWNPNPPPQQWAPQTFQQQPQWQQQPPQRPRSHTGTIVGIALGVVLMIVGVLAAYSARFDHGTSAEALEAFRRAGLEVGEVRASTRGFLDVTPQTERDGVAFDTPSAGLFAQARVWSFVNEGAQETKRSAIAGRHHWLFRRHNLLLELDERVPEARANQYPDALDGM